MDERMDGRADGRTDGRRYKEPSSKILVWPLTCRSARISFQVHAAVSLFLKPPLFFLYCFFSLSVYALYAEFVNCSPGVHHGARDFLKEIQTIGFVALPRPSVDSTLDLEFLGYFRSTKNNITAKC